MLGLETTEVDEYVHLLPHRVVSISLLISTFGGLVDADANSQDDMKGVM